MKRSSIEQYGERVIEGSDMFEQEQTFLEFVRARDLSIIDEWAKTLTCPILHLDGTNAVSGNIQAIVESYGLTKYTHLATGEF